MTRTPRKSKTLWTDLKGRDLSWLQPANKSAWTAGLETRDAFDTQFTDENT